MVFLQTTTHSLLMFIYTQKKKWWWWWLHIYTVFYVLYREPWLLYETVHLSIFLPFFILFLLSPATSLAYVEEKAFSLICKCDAFFCTDITWNVIQEERERASERAKMYFICECVCTQLLSFSQPFPPPCFPFYNLPFEFLLSLVPS